MGFSSSKGGGMGRTGTMPPRPFGGGMKPPRPMAVKPGAPMTGPNGSTSYRFNDSGMAPQQGGQMGIGNFMQNQINQGGTQPQQPQSFMPTQQGQQMQSQWANPTDPSEARNAELLRGGPQMAQRAQMADQRQQGMGQQQRPDWASLAARMRSRKFR